MQKKLLFKAVIVVALMLLIGVALMKIHATISERNAFRDEAVRSIAADSVGEQSVTGPVLVLPYTEEYGDEPDATAAPVDGPVPKPVMVRRTRERRLLVFPNELQIAGVIGTERRYRGIHQVLVYDGQYKFTGDFTLPALADLPRKSPDSRLTMRAPFIALAVADVRGVRNIPKIGWGGREIEFEQGSGLLSFKNGLHATLAGTEPLVAGAKVGFKFDLSLDGIERQHFVPVARNNVVRLKSSWAHPQFGGRFLPSARERTISAAGFDANWRISALASDAQQQLRHLESRSKAGDVGEAGAAPSEVDRFSVGFIEPVNIYTQADRATKYGLLFVALTFLAFFAFEILKRLPIHPVQYLLVGLALALFFLLLVGLSEHIDFLQSYLVASAACIALNAFYLSYVLGSWRRGSGFGVALTVLYGALYGLLNSESNALLMGSILLFMVLAALMVATRKVDWYRIGKEEEQGA